MHTKNRSKLWIEKEISDIREMILHTKNFDNLSILANRLTYLQMLLYLTNLYQ